MLNDAQRIVAFWSHVQKTETCWLWTAVKTLGGYGIFNAGGFSMRAHLFAASLTGVRVTNKIEGHHACPNKNCVRIHPEHVVIVPRQENPDSASHINRLKTHCKRGHLLSGDNLINSTWRPRRCRVCANMWNDIWNKKRAEQKRLAKLHQR